MRSIIVAQKVKHLWHLQILLTTLLIACGRFRCTARVQPIIVAMAIAIIMQQKQLLEFHSQKYDCKVGKQLRLQHFE
jgi:hypothetical protein